MNKKSEYGYILNWAKKIKAINLLGSKCHCCNETRPWLLQFHHKNPNEKEFTINNFKEYRWSIIEPEIKKCILLCGNCHGEYEFNKNTIIEKRNTNKILVLEYLQKYKCDCCGYDRCNKSLHFHHNIPENKLFIISQYINDKTFESVYDIDNKLKDELNKCQLICSNCHYDLHFDKEKFNHYKEKIYTWNYKERPKSIDIVLVQKLLEQGYKQVDIRKQLNCAKSTICGIIKKYKQDVG